MPLTSPPASTLARHFPLTPFLKHIFLSAFMIAASTCPLIEILPLAHTDIPLMTLPLISISPLKSIFPVDKSTSPGIVSTFLTLRS